MKKVEKNIVEETQGDKKKKIVYLCRNLLDRLYPLSGRHRAKRLGRGKGSGKGKTSGRGDKGQYARNSAPALRLIIKNLIRKLPKRGMAGKPVTTLELSMNNLKHLVETNGLKTVNKDVVFTLLNTPKKYTKLKIIHSSYVEKIPAISLECDRISTGAKAFIEKNKGSVKVLIENKG